MVGLEPTSCRACAFSAIDHHNRIPIYQLSYIRIKVVAEAGIEPAQEAYETPLAT